MYYRESSDFQYQIQSGSIQSKIVLLGVVLHLMQEIYKFLMLVNTEIPISGSNIAARIP